MIEMKNWSNLEEAFSLLNKKCRYLVLRNFENFFDDILVEGHNDIDVLCGSIRDRKKMIQILQATPRIGVDNGIHYKFLYKGKEIALDIRTVGDGYYDKKWQKNMIASRIFNKKGFYTMDDENYFYSLIYHAIYQKPTLSKDYYMRLNAMKLEKKEYSQIQFEESLYDFMKKKKYFYTKTYDFYVITYFNKDLVSERIKYPIEIHLHHLYEKYRDYFLGKINGAKVKFIKYVKKS